MTTTRDQQRSRVYEAEYELRDFFDNAHNGFPVEIGGSVVALPPEARFSSPETVQAYVDRVLSHPAVVDKYGATTLTVRKRKGTTRAHYMRAGAEIAVPDTKWALREIVVLHEVAHHFSPLAMAHGPSFTKTLLWLLDTIMGPEAAFALRVLYYENKVTVA